MKSLDELQNELFQAKAELESITIKREGNTPFMSGQLDSWKSDGYSYKEYTDKSRANYLISKINNLNNQINNYARNAERFRMEKEQRELETHQRTQENITSTAKKIYDEKLDAYMDLNLWGKAKAMFSGKKPKKMNQQEIIDTYGNDAVNQITSPAIAELLRQKEEQLKSVNVMYANDPQMLAHAIRETERYFNEEIKRIENTYDRLLNEIGGGRSK